MDRVDYSVQEKGAKVRNNLCIQRLHNCEECTGTGTSLAVCRRIVDVHGGRFWVESQSGEGSTFFFTLPASQTAQDAEESC